VCKSDVCPHRNDCPDCTREVCWPCFQAVLDKIMASPNHQAILKALKESGD